MQQARICTICVMYLPKSPNLFTDVSGNGPLFPVWFGLRKPSIVYYMSSSIASATLSSAIAQFKDYKAIGEKAMAQCHDEELTRTIAARVE